MSLLPGARDLRTPTTVGLILAAAVWVSVWESIPERDDAAGFVEFLYQTSSLLGGAVLAGVGVFVAYLVGSIVASETMRLIERSRLARRLQLLLAPDVERRSQQAIADLLFRVGGGRIRGWRPSRRSTLWELADRYRSDAAPDLISEVLAEAPTLAVPLRVANKDLYDDFDRRRSEGQLRLCILAPSVVLIAALAHQFGPPIWIAVILPVLTARSGLVSLSEANEVVVLALAHGIIQSGVVNEWRQEQARREDEERRDAEVRRASEKEGARIAESARVLSSRPSRKPISAEDEGSAGRRDPGESPTG